MADATLSVAVAVSTNPGTQPLYAASTLADHFAWVRRAPTGAAVRPREVERVDVLTEPVSSQVIASAVAAAFFVVPEDDYTESTDSVFDD